MRKSAKLLMSCCSSSEELSYAALMSTHSHYTRSAFRVSKSSTLVFTGVSRNHSVDRSHDSREHVYEFDIVIV